MEGNITNKTLNCTGDDRDREECKVDEKMVTQFKVLIVIIFILLIFFLGCYVYNLIKCYLPKWRKKAHLQEEKLQPAQIVNEPKKYEGVMIEL